MSDIVADDRAWGSLSLHEKASITKKIIVEDIDAFGALSGDMNPLHVDDVYAASTQSGKRVVHGMYLGALVSQLVGMKLPGKRALLLKETLEFKHPVHIGDQVVVEGEVVTKSESTKIMEIQIVITREGEVVVLGSVHVRVRE